jgi:chromosome segregation ATPase
MQTKSTQELIDGVATGIDQILARLYLSAALIAEGDKAEAKYHETQSRLKEAEADLAEVQRERDEVEKEVSVLRAEHAHLTGVLNQAKENLKEEAA